MDGWNTIRFLLGWLIFRGGLLVLGSVDLSVFFASLPPEFCYFDVKLDEPIVDRFQGENRFRVPRQKRGKKKRRLEKRHLFHVQLPVYSLRDPKGIYPIRSMGLVSGIFAYIYHKHQPNAGNYTIHGWYGYCYPNA